MGGGGGMVFGCDFCVFEWVFFVICLSNVVGCGRRVRSE